MFQNPSTAVSNPRIEAANPKGNHLLVVTVSRDIHDGGVAAGETSDWDEAFYVALGRAVERLIERGMGHEDAVRRAAEHFTDGLSNAIGPSIADSLRESAPEMLAEHYVLNREFEDRLHERWGKALDLYYMVAVAVQEFGATGYQTAVNAVGSDNQRALLEALTGVHARSCRTAFEVHSLLSSGFPKGAQARARTIYELAVIAIVLSRYGTEAGYEDLGERFRAFSDLTTALDARDFQQHAERLGVEPFTDEEMQDFAALREARMRLHPDIDRRQGWASRLPGYRAGTFEELERMAELDYLRPFYTEASHEVHPYPKGVANNVTATPDGLVKLSGRTNAGLSHGARDALVSLLFATNALRRLPGFDGIKSWLSAEAIARLVREACEAFDETEEAVVRAVEELACPDGPESTLDE